MVNTYVTTKTHDLDRSLEIRCVVTGIHHTATHHIFCLIYRDCAMLCVVLLNNTIHLVKKYSLSLSLNMILRRSIDLRFLYDLSLSQITNDDDDDESMYV